MSTDQQPIAPIKEQIPYPKEQVIHSFSSFSNAAFGIKTYTSVAALQQYANGIVTKAMSDATITKCVGTDWQLAWGPIIYSNEPHANNVVADNTMMMVYSPSQKLIIVSIAGTNIDSTYGWLKEDFNVSTTVTWQSVVGAGVSDNIPADAAISEGTNLGLEALLSMQDNNGHTLIDALSSLLAQSTTGSGLELAVAGHSLGGTLSPVMALYLQNITTDSSLNWNTSGKVTTVSAWPTAGPTPGEANFATYLPTIVSYTSRFNTLDVIPQAWESDHLATVPSLYDSYIKPVSGAVPADAVLGVLTTAAFLNSNDIVIDGISITVTQNNYQQAQPRTPITGTFALLKDMEYYIGINEIFNDLTVPAALQQYQNYLTNFARFILQMGYQHTTAYSTLLGIETVANEYTDIKDNNNPEGKTMEDMHREAAAKAVGIYVKSFNLGAFAHAAVKKEAAATAL
jgi:hypothetical protein